MTNSKCSSIKKESLSTKFDSKCNQKNDNEYFTSTPLNSNKCLNYNSNNNDKISNVQQSKITPKQNHKGSKRYFNDFYENIKDFDDEYIQKNDNNKKPRNQNNNDSDSDDLPAIFSIAKRRQEELKAKLKNKINK